MEDKSNNTLRSRIQFEDAIRNHMVNRSGKVRCWKKFQQRFNIVRLKLVGLFHYL